MTVWRLNTNGTEENPLPDEGRRPLEDRAGVTYSEDYLSDAKRPKEGDRIFAYHNGSGFIGYGTVLSEEPTVITDSEGMYYETASTENQLDIIWHYHLPSECAVEPSEIADIMDWDQPDLQGPVRQLDESKALPKLVEAVRDRARKHISRPDAAANQETVESDGYTFNLTAIHTALWLFGDLAATPTVEEIPDATEALAEYFCDWGPHRDGGDYDQLQSLDMSQEAAQNILKTWTSDVATALTAPDGPLAADAVDADTIAALGREIAYDTFPELTYDYLLNYIWLTTTHLHALKSASEDGSESAIPVFTRQFEVLPDGLIDYWRGRENANDTRQQFQAQVIDAYVQGRLTYEKYDEILESIETRSEADLAHGNPRFTVLGGIYYELLAPRVKHHLSLIANTLRSIVGDESLRVKIVGFIDSQGVLSDSSWLALYSDKPPANPADHYQIYLGFRHDRVNYGLDVGEASRESDWRSIRDIDSIDRSSDVVRMSDIESKVRAVKPEFERLNTYGPRSGDETDLDPTAELDVTLSADELSGLHFPETMGETAATLVQKAQAALNSGNHIIFTGPPGTGKTELAEQLTAQLLAMTDLYTDSHLTTATADWSTFETVGGYMPARDGGRDLEFRPGQLLRRWKRNGHQQNDLTIIDEINRADIDKAFGPLFTVLSGQRVELSYETRQKEEISIRPANKTDAPQAGDEQEVPLAEYVVPRSWRLIATMNSYDKTSLYDMSYAFMRRFTFIRVDAPPIPDPQDTDPSPVDLLAGYLEHWDDITLDAENEASLGVLDAWRIMNETEAARSLGPAIAKDMLGYVQQLPCESPAQAQKAVADAVVGYVFPQLEGMLSRQRTAVINDLAAATRIDEQTIRRGAAEQFRG